MAKKKSAKAGKPRTRRGVKLKPTQLTPAEIARVEPTEAVTALAEAIVRDGGSVLAMYREPLGGNTIVFAALPIDKVERTPFQRDVSDAHVLKLTRAMDKTKRFLDPIIAVRAADGYHSPNGGHRLTALKELGAKSVLALVVPEPHVAYQILALNIEKAHNLRERASEVMRMYRDLAASSDLGESDLELEFEEPALVTLGFAYEQRGRLAGGAYHTILKKVDGFLEGPLSKTLPRREERARVVLEFDDAVSDTVKRLKERGFDSPYLKNFVVARVNPLRFMKGDVPPFDELFASMTKRARGMNADKIKTQDIARSGGPVEDA